tara:strand:+ start:8 stop:139 length:132 start_codon:yes stop_codon:yes gene_type:complete
LAKLNPFEYTTVSLLAQANNKKTETIRGKMDFIALPYDTKNIY